MPAPFAYGGIAGDYFVTGDWAGTGYQQAGVYRLGSGYWLLDADGSHQYNTSYLFGGLPSDLPIVGKW